MQGEEMGQVSKLESGVTKAQDAKCHNSITKTDPDGLLLLQISGCGRDSRKNLRFNCYVSQSRAKYY
jgi:hypothetical protein